MDVRFLDAAEYYDDDFGRPGELIASFSPINYAGDENADNVSNGGGDGTNRSDLGEYQRSHSEGDRQESMYEKNDTNDRGIKQRKGWRGFNKRASAPVAPIYGGDLSRENGGGACALSQTSCSKEKNSVVGNGESQGTDGNSRVRSSDTGECQDDVNSEGGAPIENNVPWWHKLDHSRRGVRHTKKESNSKVDLSDLQSPGGGIVYFL